MPEAISITGPQSVGMHTDARPQPQPTPDTDGLRAARLNAAIAAEHLAALQRAADARHRAGTWAPAAAVNAADFTALGAAQDAARR